jgi:uncharacterized protein (DUF2062 family)
LSSHELGLAVALGSACAFFPVLGLATPLCLLVGILLRLNHALIQSLNALTTPIYPLVVLGFIQLGARLTGASGAIGDFSAFSRLWSDLVSGSHSGNLLAGAAALAAHAILGWLVASFAAVPLIYVICRLTTTLTSVPS